MKLAKVTWMLEWYSDTVNGVSHIVMEAKKQVKEWKEDAEKLRLIRNQNEWDKLISLRVRLQKRIETLENVYPDLKNSKFDVHLIDSPSETNVKVRKMLQKILDDKNE